MYLNTVRMMPSGSLQNSKGSVLHSNLSYILRIITRSSKQNNHKETDMFMALI